MSRLKSALIIFAILCCNPPANSRPRTWLKSYTFQSQRVAVGRNHIDKSSVAYTVYETQPYRRDVRCTVVLEKNVFASDKQTYVCPVAVSTRHRHGKIKILETHLWGENRVIFTWQDIDEYNLKRAEVTIRTFDMTNCGSTTNQVVVDNYDDERAPIIIAASPSNYSVSFLNKDRCDDNVCRITIDVNGGASVAESWFFTSGTLYAVEQIENHANKIAIATEENYEGDLEWVYYLLDEAGIRELGRNNDEEDLGWSTANGIISFCTNKKCSIYNYEGQPLNPLTFLLEHEPHEVAALYNSPAGGHFAVFCDEHPNGNYRFVKTGKNGEQKFTAVLDGLDCSFEPDNLTVKLFPKSSEEYCVSVFQSVYSRQSWGSFSTYCFSTSDMTN